MCGLKATSHISVFNKRCCDSHQEGRDIRVNAMSDKYSFGATQAKKNEGNYFFVLSLECSVPQCAHKTEKPITSQQCHSGHKKCRKQVGFRGGARSVNKNSKEMCKNIWNTFKLKGRIPEKIYKKKRRRTTTPTKTRTRGMQL